MNEDSYNQQVILTNKSLDVVVVNKSYFVDSWETSRNISTLLETTVLFHVVTK